MEPPKVPPKPQLKKIAENINSAQNNAKNLENEKEGKISFSSTSTISSLKPSTNIFLFEKTKSVSSENPFDFRRSTSNRKKTRRKQEGKNQSFPALDKEKAKKPSLNKSATDDVNNENAVVSASSRFGYSIDHLKKNKPNFSILLKDENVMENDSDEGKMVSFPEEMPSLKTNKFFKDIKVDSDEYKKYFSADLRFSTHREFDD
ncbi:hypothetical protein MHBO_003776 [Bonamia ostreae]|uniref:Uncharacterized protein n=1 Tax=Bonamia ostreae TaxID=126728 RepID=A0ABV2AS92_9EUKA